MEDSLPPESDMRAPPARHRLSTRIVTSLILVLLLALTMISGTLWLSWQLEGAGAAINDAGSLRMHANRVAIELSEAAAGRPEHIGQELTATDNTLLRLAHGDPARPLFLPNDPIIRQQMQDVREDWNVRLAPIARQVQADGQVQPYLAELPGFVAKADRLVSLIEQNNADKTSLLRMSQAVLAAIACAGTIVVIYLFYLWIVEPVMRLQMGLRRMARREFGVRLPLDSEDEFGVLARGFNHMADELAGLYGELESRVAQKTAELAAQNRELAALYDIANFLNQPNDVESLCRGFLQRVEVQFGADAGSIRVLDPNGSKLHLLVSNGLSSELKDAEHCLQADACFCGKATRQGAIVVHDFRHQPKSEHYGCAKEGFLGLSVFRIVTKQAVLGSFSLHFSQPLELPRSEVQLLDTLGQHLGTALENLRLEAKARQLAVAQERNLVAQGLHDSIAQGLNFLNLQVQMLDDAVDRNCMEEVRDVLPMLQAGVAESYQDVRELLLNFRSKLEQGELRPAIEETLGKFRRQTGILTSLQMEEQEGAPLPPEQQLQVLFILQEALSNVRKHAQAHHVAVSVTNARDFALVVEDDGVGFDEGSIGVDREQHVGLDIMRERAHRLAATLQVQSRSGQGTRVSLHLPNSERQAA